MIAVNTIPHQWVQTYPCLHFLKVCDIYNIRQRVPPHEINQLLNRVHSKGKPNLQKAQQKSVK